MKKILSCLFSLVSFSAFSEVEGTESPDQFNHFEYEESFEEELTQPSQIKNSYKNTIESEQNSDNPEKASEAPIKMDTKDYKKKPKDTVY